jgi:hypothetical protein
MEAVDNSNSIDPESESLSGLLHALRDEFGGDRFTAKDITERLRSSFSYDDTATELEHALEELSPKTGKLSTRTIGRILSYRVDRLVDGQVLRTDKKTNVKSWRVEIPKK